MLTALQKNFIRKTAKKVFKIPKSTWINVFEITPNQYKISYLVGKYHETERNELLVLERNELTHLK